MTRYLYGFLIFFSISTVTFAQALTDEGNYWQCTTHDETQTQWSYQSIYQKIALNLAYDECKKKSQIPATCKTSKADCDQFIEGVNVTPLWECTAFDRTALSWKSSLYPQREDAALGAQAYCKHKSSVPDTCSINLVTCINKNET